MKKQATKISKLLLRNYKKKLMIKLLKVKNSRRTTKKDKIN